jgi:hypothetical protein
LDRASGFFAARLPLVFCFAVDLFAAGDRLVEGVRLVKVVLMNDPFPP